VIDGCITASSAVRRPTVRGLFAGVPFGLAAQEAGEHAATFLGLPLWLWQLVNLVLFLGVMLYFVARPLAAMFRNRQLEVEERLKEAKALRAEAARLEAQVHERMVRLDQEIVEIRARGIAEGEAERAALSERADLEVERVRREAEEEIGRRLAAAKQELRRVAADLTANAARELLAGEINEEDRRRLLEESLARLGEKSPAGKAGS
jgi:F-type H+-transporting ATPase subunit b